MSGAIRFRPVAAMLAVAAATTVAVLAERPPGSIADRRLVMDDTHQIPPAEWSYAEVPVPGPAMLLQSEFHVVSAAPKVRLCLIRLQDLDSYRRNQNFACMAGTSYTAGGKLACPVQGPAKFALVVENRSGPFTSPSQVRLRIWLQTTRSGQSLPAWKQALTIGISFLIFLALAAYSARKLLPVVAQRREIIGS